MIRLRVRGDASACARVRCEKARSQVFRRRGVLNGGSVMDQVRRCNRTAGVIVPHCDRELTTTVASPYHGKRSGAVLLRLIPFCLAALLVSVAVDQSRADNGGLRFPN